MAFVPDWPVLKPDFESIENIRALQHLLNYRNGNNNLVATGSYDTATENAVKSYQSSHGLMADGIAGSGTLSSLISGLNIQSGAVNNAVKAAQYLLSKFESVSVTGLFSSSSVEATKAFQQEMGITPDGVVGATTWRYLFGYYFYPRLGCDTATELTSSQVQILKNNGYGYIGRYLPGSNYPLTAAEKQRIVSAGLFIYSLWEKDNPGYISYFTSSRGTSDARNAISGAKSIGQPLNTPIYFTVDYDAPIEDITGGIHSYLLAIKNEFIKQNYPYKLGLYGDGALLNYYKNTFTYTMLAGASSWNGSASYSKMCIKQIFTNPGIGIDIDINYSNGAAGGWQ